MSDKTKVRDLKDQDLIDLLEVTDNDPNYFLDPLTAIMAQHELAVVGSEDGVHTVQPDGVWVLHTDAGSFGMDPDWLFTVHGSWA